ncbi:putative dna repair protein rad14 protein [Neofusicoccum parvum UCRNP2]|uniref:Putative dna repair protein rad14 protein n=1 Tax=Botryosphaeria parva (strain UCR-NP2) TaxID=1287680 RepID=R1EEW7_BOTPV|nr:putative dna repair protein rad14 protein [Neofusicoccum parvum UCRNP2]
MATPSSSSAHRPKTPPPPTASTTNSGSLPKAPLTPEQVRQLEINRLKAKALRSQADAAAAVAAASTSTTAHAGQKRPHSAISAATRPRNHRDGTSATPGTAGGMTAPSDNAYIRAAKKFEKSSYIEYDLSAMTDTKGGFLSTADDPHNRALNSGVPREDREAGGGEQKPAHMTLAEWQRHQLLKKLRAAKAGPFEPGISVLDGDAAGTNACGECGSREIDFQWRAVFGVAVCGACKERLPERYSLLTKTEAREDYLLTDPELRDEQLFPRLERPNPRSATYHSMQLFLRCQLEAYAFSARKWGGPDALDAEFARREADKKDRREKRFKSKLDDLKKRTRVEAYRRSRQAGAAVGDGIGLGGSGATAQFGDKVAGRFDRHEHEWGRSVEDPETGLTKKRCVECGMEVEELEF